MQSNGVFRAALFGGYNKEDVMNYIQAMENDMEAVKLRGKKESSELKVEIQKLTEEKEMLEQRVKELQAQAQSRDADAKVQEERVPAESAREDSALKEELAGARRKAADAADLRRRLQKAEEELRRFQNVGINAEKSRRLEDEIALLKEKKERCEEEFQAITRVLSDARKSAEKIEEDAKKRAKELLDQARSESEELKARLKTQIDKDLENKGIRLMAAKYKIEAYRKEINATQQKLYHLYNDMGKMTDSMPQRLEQLWEGDEYFALPGEEAAAGTEPDGKEALDTAEEIR